MSKANGTRARIDGASRRRRRATLLSFGVVLLALGLAPASALAASAGLKPSEAPLIAVGQHYFGSTSHSGNDGFRSVDLWHLPPLLTSDVITVAWNATATGDSPALCLAQDVDDYSWAERGCNGSEEYEVSGSGSARSVIQIKSATSAAFLEFWGDGPTEASQAYDFTVESIQHAIGVGLAPKLHMHTRAVLTASAGLSNGLPVPDGLTFYLNATWGKTGAAQYSATTSGGQMNFPVTLPPETISQTVTFTITRPADPQYLEAKSAGLKVKVARPKPPTVTRRHRHHHRHHRRHHHRRHHR